MRIIDLSVPLDNDRNWAPRWARSRVKHQSHRHGRLAIWTLFGLEAEYLRTGLGWANDEIKLSTHGTTHLDAPWHYAPTSEGKKARTIDEVPLEWCYSDGLVLDIRHKKDGEAISVDDVKKALADINHTIKPMDIVLIQTGNDRMLGTPNYFTRGAGVSAAATRWILDQGVKVTGIDSWGWMCPCQPWLARPKKRDGAIFSGKPTLSVWIRNTATLSD